MKVQIDDLRRVTNILIDHLEDLGSIELELDVDFYWNVPADARYDPYVQPVVLDLGQLYDDWGELLKVARGQRPPFNFYLVWLAAILQRIGESTPERSLRREEP